MLMREKYFICSGGEGWGGVAVGWRSDGGDGVGVKSVERRVRQGMSGFRGRTVVGRRHSMRG